jgi:CheY-like chemotaxis protein
MAGSTILVVDDDEPTRTIMAEILEEEGYVAEVAADGVEGLQAVEALAPDLVVTNITMPVMDGQALTEVLHEQETETPVVMVSASSKGEQIAEQSGAAAFVEKPFEIDELVDTVTTLLDKPED